MKQQTALFLALLAAGCRTEPDLRNELLWGPPIRRLVILSRLGRDPEKAKSYLGELKICLFGPDPVVGLRAGQVLARTGEEGIEILRAALKEKDPEVRWRAAASFLSDQVSVGKAKKELLAALSDEDPTTRQFAVLALFRARVPEARKKIEALLLDADSGVRKTAERVLKQWKIEPAQSSKSSGGAVPGALPSKN